MEMPAYKWPPPRTVVGRMAHAGCDTVGRAAPHLRDGGVLVRALV